MARLKRPRPFGAPFDSHKTQQAPKRLKTLEALSVVRLCGLRSYTVEWSTRGTDRDASYSLEHSIDSARKELVLYLRKIEKGVVHLDETESASSFSSESESEQQPLFAPRPQKRRKVGQQAEGMITTVSITFSSLRRIDLPDKSPHAVLVLEHPPRFATASLQIDQYPTLVDHLSSIDDAHARIAPFVATTFRLTFTSRQAIPAFLQDISPSGVNSSKVRDFKRRPDQVYSDQSLHELDAWMSELTPSIAFQIATLLHNGVLDASQLCDIRLAINRTVVELEEDDVEQTLKVFHDFLVHPRMRQQAFSFAADIQEDQLVRVPFHQIIEADYLTRALLEMRLREAEKVARKSKHLRTPPDRQSRVLIVTPSRMKLSGPVSGESNSIFRRYSSNTASFLRVSLRSEDGDRLRYDRDQEDAMNRFVNKRFLPFFPNAASIQPGRLELAGRSWDFLAYSASGLKDHTCFFVSPFHHNGELITADKIRSGLGDFSSLARTPAKWMARISQALTSTRPGVMLRPEQIQSVPDIEVQDDEGRVGSCFTDGVGSISEGLAKEVMEQLDAGLSVMEKERRGTSSCFQIRLGGAKGMLAVDLTLKGKRVALRPSQTKFLSHHTALDIADTFTRPLRAYLNIALVKILEDLGVDAKTFQDLQSASRKRIVEAERNVVWMADILNDFGLATSSRLSSTIVNLLDIAYITRDDISSPFFRDCTELAFAHAQRELKYKARILIPGSWNLVGVADASGFLKENEIFACVHEPGKEAVWLQGPVAISRSPTMAPGDIQLVTAVGQLPLGATAISHLTNCVVFSTQGARSLPSKLAGGDLDGDMYLVITDPSLIPHRFCEPASYDAPAIKRLDRECTVADGADFFLRFPFRDQLGVVSTRHFWIADFEIDGVEHPDCITLARLHSDAVDFSKNAVPVQPKSIPRCASRGERPDFLAREGQRSYKSTKVLGKLFRAVPDEATKAKIHGVDQLNRLDPGKTLTKAITEEHAFLSDQLGPSLKQEMLSLLSTFSAELNRISQHTSMERGLPPTEVELFVGLRRHSPRDIRKSEKTSLMRMQDQTSSLFDALRAEICPDGQGTKRNAQRAWAGWLTMLERETSDVIGVHSFGWIALGLVSEALRDLIEQVK